MCCFLETTIKEYLTFYLKKDFKKGQQLKLKSYTLSNSVLLRSE